MRFTGGGRQSAVAHVKAEHPAVDGDLIGRREIGPGRIVNISSVLGRFTLPGTGVSAATKYALEAVSDALRVELAPFGVRVVLVEPGIVDTALYAHAAATATEYLGELIPYGGLFRYGVAFPDKLTRTASTPHEVAKTVAKAATVKRPRPRYVPGARNRLNVRLLASMPSPVADRIKRGLMGLDTSAAAAGAGAAPSANSPESRARERGLAEID